MTPAEREALLALAAAATPGPWQSHERTCCSLVYDSTGEVGIHQRPMRDGESAFEHLAFDSVVESDQANANAAFIAASRTAVPSLLSALSEAEAERDRLRGENECLRGYMTRVRVACGKAPADCYTPWEAAEALRERVRLAEAWLSADDAADRVQQSSTAAYSAREAFRASGRKGGE